MQYQYIDGFENYIITNEGQVFNVKKQKYLTLTKNNCGYYMVSLYNDQGMKKCYVHSSLKLLSTILTIINKLIISTAKEKTTISKTQDGQHDLKTKEIETMKDQNLQKICFGNTEFVEILPEDAYSFEKYNDYQFRGYYIDSDDIIYQKITDNRYKIMKKMKAQNIIQINDEDNIQRSISIPKLHNLTKIYEI